jgi:bis(5'-adenosyl)-triphosphatase
MTEQSIPMITCPFCSPDNQGIAFASSDSFLALYNIAPILPGHTLIIPRKHIKSLRALPDDLISEFFLFSRKVTEVLLKYYHADAFDWSLQDNEAAGQTVQHLHLHIIMRHPSDLPEPGDWYPLLESQNKNDSNQRPDLGKEEYSRVAESLKTVYDEAEKASLDSNKK